MVICVYQSTSNNNANNNSNQIWRGFFQLTCFLNHSSCIIPSCWNLYGVIADLSNFDTGLGNQLNSCSWLCPKIWGSLTTQKLPMCELSQLAGGFKRIDIFCWWFKADSQIFNLIKPAKRVILMIIMQATFRLSEQPLVQKDLMQPESSFLLWSVWTPAMREWSCNYNLQDST